MLAKEDFFTIHYALHDKKQPKTVEINEEELDIKQKDGFRFVNVSKEGVSIITFDKKPTANKNTWKTWIAPIDSWGFIEGEEIKKSCKSISLKEGENLFSARYNKEQKLLQKMEKERQAELEEALLEEEEMEEGESEESSAESEYEFEQSTDEDDSITDSDGEGGSSRRRKPRVVRKGKSSTTKKSSKKADKKTDKKTKSKTDDEEEEDQKPEEAEQEDESQYLNANNLFKIHFAIHDTTQKHVGLSGEDGAAKEFKIEVSKSGCRKVMINGLNIIEQDVNKSTRYASAAKNGQKITWIIPPNRNAKKWGRIEDNKIVSFISGMNIKETDSLEYVAPKTEVRSRKNRKPLKAKAEEVQE